MNQNAEMAQISSDRSRCPEQIKDPPQIRPWQDRTGHFSYYIIGKSIQSSGNTAGTDAYSGKCSSHGKEEAMDMVTEIIQELYSKTGGFNIKEYWKNR